MARTVEGSGLAGYRPRPHQGRISWTPLCLDATGKVYDSAISVDRRSKWAKGDRLGRRLRTLQTQRMSTIVSALAVQRKATHSGSIPVLIGLDDQVFMAKGPKDCEALAEEGLACQSIYHRRGCVPSDERGQPNDGMCRSHTSPISYTGRWNVL